MKKSPFLQDFLRKSIKKKRKIKHLNKKGMFSNGWQAYNTTAPMTITIGAEYVLRETPEESIYEINRRRTGRNLRLHPQRRKNRWHHQNSPIDWPVNGRILVVPTILSSLRMKTKITTRSSTINLIDWLFRGFPENIFGTDGNRHRCRCVVCLSTIRKHPFFVEMFDFSLFFDAFSQKILEKRAFFHNFAAIYRKCIKLYTLNYILPLS